MAFRSGILFSIVLLLSATSFAVDYTLPNGHREAYLANAGGSLESSPGNFLFNPAGMGFRDLDRLSLSVSGNAVSTQRIEMPAIAQDQEELQIRPLIAAAVYPTRWGTGGLFVASPVSVEINSPYESADPTGSGSVTGLVQTSSEALIAGGGFASSLNPYVAWGIAGGVQITTSKSLTYVMLKYPTLTSTMFLSSNQKHTRAFLTPGVTLKPLEGWVVGLSAKILPFAVSSEAQYFSTTHSSTTPTNVEVTSGSYDPLVGDVPYSLRLGQSFSIIGGNVIYADILYNSETSYRDRTGFTDKRKADQNYSLAWRNTSFGTWEPLVGFQKSDLERTHANLFTAGTVITRRRNEIGVGAFYYESGAKSGYDINTMQTYGVMFSSNVAY